MRYKRPGVRYSDTPPPATPYQAAAQVWDERLGSARVQAKNWRLMAFGCLALAVLMAAGLVWRAGQSLVTPYVVEVDRLGDVHAVGAAATPYKPSDAQIAYHLARFITDVRSLSIDPVVVRQNWLDAYGYTTDRGAATLNDYACVIHTMSVHGFSACRSSISRHAGHRFHAMSVHHFTACRSSS